MTRKIFYAFIVFILVAILLLVASTITIANPIAWIKALGLVGGGAIVGYILGVNSKKAEPSNKEK